MCPSIDEKRNKIGIAERQRKHTRSTREMSEKVFELSEEMSGAVMYTMMQKRNVVIVNV